MDYDEYIKQPLPFISELGKYYRKKDKLTIFEIGSCEGEDSIRLNKAYPNSSIYTFEALPKNVQIIKKNFRKYGLIGDRLHQLALSNVAGFADFYVSSGHPDELPKVKDWDYGNKSSSLLPPKETKKTHKWLKFNEKIRVSTARLDEFCAKHKIDKIDFMYIDVQGAELMVLEGAGEFIKKIGAIWMEVEAVELYKDQPLKNEVDEFMTSRGFRCIIDTVDDLSGDRLYINENLASRKLNLFRNFRNNNSLKPQQNQSVVNEGHSKVSYSQCGEDLIMKFVLDQLGIEKPTYMDIGAHHPRYINNTAIFYDLGCSGINIEPDPKLFSELAKDRDRDINLNIGVGKRKDQMDFYVMSTPTLNTFSKKEVSNYEKEGYELEETLRIKVESLNNICRQYLKKAPDFITLDAEGIDYDVIKDFNFEKYGPTVWCIETISFSQKGRGVKDKSLIKLLESKDYLYYADTYINSIFVKKEAWLR